MKVGLDNVFQIPVTIDPEKCLLIKAIGGGLGVFSQILLILAYVGSPTYLVSKMGSLSSQLRTVVEI